MIDFYSKTMICENLFWKLLAYNWIIIIIKMNRIKLDLIKQSTSVTIQQLKQITVCNPYSQGWLSDKFPIYPIIINFHISNPPFNKVSISLQPPYLPQSLTLQGSSDAKQYFKFANITQFTTPTNIVINLKQHHHYKYLRLKITEPSSQTKSTSKSNICKQVWIRCIQLTFVTFYGCEYACSMEKALQLDPCLFRILELLEYKALLAKSKAKLAKSQKSNELMSISNKYYGQIEQILTQIKQWKENPKKLSQEVRQELLKEIEILAKQPLQSINANDIDYDRQAIRKEVSQLQNELADFYIHRLNSLHKDVTDYFYRYWNKEVKEEYMRLLSSPDPDDHGKALSNFWAEVKSMQQFPLHIEQAVVMYFNYFLEYVHDPLKITAIKILCLLFRNPGLGYEIYFVYERLLFNLLSQLSDQQKKQLFQVSLKCIYTLFQKVPDSLFIQALLNPEHSVKFSMKLTKLQILQKITFKNVTIDGPSRDNIVDYILDILSIKQLTLQDKNRAYNIVAYLASLFGKQPIMSQFQKLNTMITMTMQKIVDKKLLMMKTPRKQQQTPSCQYCGITKESFRDPNLYDLHCFKDCKYLTPCRYCSKMIQIPELSKHYIHTCEQRNIFKECQNCNQVIVKAKEDQHKKQCTKQLITKCGLCGQKMQGKLKLKQHILKEGCPNNPR